jgi:DNA-binding transcriptional ArsR family regulator
MSKQLSVEGIQPDIYAPPDGAIKYVLFDSVLAAQEVACSLQAQWDGSNGLEIADLDYAALVVSADLVEAQWCEVGRSERIADHTSNADLSVAIELSGINNSQPREVTLTFPVSRSEVYWAIADWQGSQNAESISKGTGISKSTVQGHLSALEKAKAIESDGRPKRYVLAEKCPEEYLLQLEYLASIARLTRGLRGRPI